MKLSFNNNKIPYYSCIQYYSTENNFPLKIEIISFRNNIKIDKITLKGLQLTVLYSKEQKR